MADDKPNRPPTDFERFVSAIARVPKDEADAAEPTDGEQPPEEPEKKPKEKEPGA